MYKKKKKVAKKQGIVIKGKKLSTRIDMTPMVDLAFLLLTFFLLATTFIKPQVMQLVLPEKNQDTSNQPKVNEKNVMSIVLDANNKIYWYIGLTTAQVHETTYKSDGLRKILVDQVKPNDKMVVLVKPSDTSTYETWSTRLMSLRSTRFQDMFWINIAMMTRRLSRHSQGVAPHRRQGPNLQVGQLNEHLIKTFIF